MAWWMNPRLGQFAQAGMTDPDEQKKLSLVRPAYGAFRCLDGDSITIAAMEDHFWDKLVRTLELSEWAGAEFGKQTQRQQVAASINFSVAKKLASIRRDEALRRLSEADVPVAPVLSAVELLRTEHARSRGLPTPTSWGAVVRFPVTFN
jgi:crotonobetainyl-CoA:carnitine CoA-transferase CaiB-like acyl-CoA transferase